MRFNLKDKVVVITGGAGFLGGKHADAIAEIGGIPILIDIDEKKAKEKAGDLRKQYVVPSLGYKVDITSVQEIEELKNKLLNEFGRIDILINNAANNPKVAPGGNLAWGRLENLSFDLWQKDISVGLTGAFLCSQAMGIYMACHGGGVILNVASDLGIIAPDQRVYRKDGLNEDEQFVKPITYSVIKHGIIGLTKYLATYWASKGIRVNALCPGGVYNNQPEEFVEKLTNLIPMGRMAHSDEYKGAIQFLCSDASSYMTGACLVIDGGRTCW